MKQILTMTTALLDVCDHTRHRDTRGALEAMSKATTAFRELNERLGLNFELKHKPIPLNDVALHQTAAWALGCLHQLRQRPDPDTVKVLAEKLSQLRSMVTS